MVEQKNKTRKLRGGMFGRTAMLAKSAFTRATPMLSKTASSAARFASTASTDKKYLLPLSKNDFKQELELSTEGDKILSQQKLSEMVGRINPKSIPGVYKQYFPQDTATASLSKQNLKQKIAQYLEEKGKLEKEKPKENVPKAEPKETINEENNVMSNNNDENFTTISKGKDSKPAEKLSTGELSSLVTTAFRLLKERVPNKKMAEDVQKDRAQIIMQDKSTVTKMLMSYQPIADFSLLLAERPGIRKIVKKTYVASRMTISKRNVPHFKDMIIRPIANDVKDINRIIVREVHKKLDLNPKFDVKSFMKVFDTETLVELKIAIAAHFMTYGEQSTRILLKTFVDCVEQGLVTNEVLRKFLNDSLHNPDDGLKYLKEILKESAKKSLELKRTRKQQFVKSIGWFGGRMLWSVVALSGAATLLLFMGFAGVKSGIPIVDNLYFRLFYKQEGAPAGAIDKVTKLIKEKIEEGVEESEVMGRFTLAVLQELYGDNLENVKGPLKEVAQKIKKKYLESTKPYRKQTFLEWLTSPISSKE